MTEFEIIFHPIGRKTVQNQSTTILQAAEKIGLNVSGPCGGKGKCGKCGVRIVKFPRNIFIPPDPVSRLLLNDTEQKKGLRLACTFRAFDNLEVELPTWVYEQREHTIETSAILAKGWLHPAVERELPFNPSIKIIKCSLPKPSLDDNISDFERLKKYINNNAKFEGETTESKDIIIKNSILQELTHTCHENDWKIDVIISHLPGKLEILDSRASDPQELELENKEPNKKSKRGVFGIALDLGTSTIVAYLIDLVTGDELSVISAVNPQINIGADLISRIRYSSSIQSGDSQLNEILIDAINKLIRDICDYSNIDQQDIFEIVAVGNTAMIHYFLNIPLNNLGSAPYTPVFNDDSYFDSKELSLDITQSGKVYIGPMVAGFMGADAVCTALISNLTLKKNSNNENGKTKLALDIGTNAEILLSANDRILGCSTAAGPAFEGSNLRFGTRAVIGAINEVGIRDKKVLFRTIGRQRPIGITGSGVVEAISEFIRARAIYPNGNINLETEKKWLRYQKKMKLKKVSSPTTSCDLILPELCIVPRNRSGLDTSITLTQTDIREIQLAKAAIRTGIEILLGELNMTSDEIDELYMAGAFGNYLKPKCAIDIKLLPEIDENKITSLGNSAGTGAKLLLRSGIARKTVKKLAGSIEYIDLAAHPKFQDMFIKNIEF
jgi:uncharacterized 2Fe-2S/4Fe-4S cluster protein (DUF4445 family)